MCVCVCVCVCLSAIISSQEHLGRSSNFLCTLPKAVARSSSGGVVIRYVLPVLYNVNDVVFAHKPRLLDVAAQLNRRAHAALGLAINCAHCAVIPVAGQRTHESDETTFWALKVTSQVATTGAESAVYDCIVGIVWCACLALANCNHQSVRYAIAYDENTVVRASITVGYTTVTGEC